MKTLNNVKNILEKLKKEDIYPWDVEALEYNEALIENGYITEKEAKEILKIENLHDVLKESYKNFRPELKDIEIPENVLKAYKAAKKDYTVAGICEDILCGISDYWYDDVLSSWAESFDKIEDGALSLYLYGNKQGEKKMSKIKINEKQFNNKEEAINYINDLKEVLVVRILAYPDLNEGRHGPILKNEYFFKASNKMGNFEVKEDTYPIVAELRNTLIDIYGREYDFVMGSRANPVKLWDVKVDYEISDKEDVESLNLDELIKKVKDSFKDRLY